LDHAPPPVGSEVEQCPVCGCQVFFVRRYRAHYNARLEEETPAWAELVCFQCSRSLAINHDLQDPASRWTRRTLRLSTGVLLNNW
jgi:hypothetical protein